MKRRFVLYGMLVAIIVVGVPFLMGQWIEKQYGELIQIVSENRALTLEPISYERGWLSSTAITRVHITDPTIISFIVEVFQDTKTTGRPANLTLNLTHHLHHGPIVRRSTEIKTEYKIAQAVVHSELFLTEEALATLEKKIGDVQLVQIESEVSIDGELEILLNGAPITIKEHEDDPANIWQGISGQWSLSDNFRLLNGSVVMPGMTFDHLGADFNFSDFIYKTSQNRIQPHLWLGQSSTSLREANIVNKALNQRLRLSEANVGTRIERSGDLIGTALSVQLASLEFNGKKYGPLNYVGKIGNLDPNIFSYLNRISTTLRSRGLTKDRAHETEQLKRILPYMLVTRPSIIVRQLRLQTPDGIAQASLQLRLGGPNAFNLDDPKAIIKSITGEGTISIPRGFMRQLLRDQIHLSLSEQDAVEIANIDNVRQLANKRIADWIRAGYIKVSGPNYESHFELSAAKLTVNGTELAIPYDSLQND